MKNEIIKFYEETGKHYGSYHDHKETCAWAGVVLHFVFCGTVTKIISTDNSTPCVNHIFAMLLAFETACILIYMNAQLKAKDMAAALNAAAMVLQLELLRGNQDETALKEYLNVEESDDLALRASHVLPIKLLRKAKAINAVGRDVQLATKWIALRPPEKRPGGGKFKEVI